MSKHRDAQRVAKAHGWALRAAVRAVKPHAIIFRDPLRDHLLRIIAVALRAERAAVRRVVARQIAALIKKNSFAPRILYDLLAALTKRGRR